MAGPSPYLMFKFGKEEDREEKEEEEFFNHYKNDLKRHECLIKDLKR